MLPLMLPPIPTGHLLGVLPTLPPIIAMPQPPPGVKMPPAVQRKKKS